MNSPATDIDFFKTLFHSGSGSSDGAENGTGEKLSPGKLSEFTTPSPGPSGNSYSLLQSVNVRKIL